ncbi:class I SAM-dependent methyltransferase [Nostocoides sp. F2B08]|uniref:class I SAM-dependent methyltransferase n=1 Tax=Nostocoides sp. F2B08 TaxID=2653936 RepID=UPI0012631D9D|nr:class I SAM-dependent methyltransferase [Tetrasphaera sp. F2B08]KAB7743582.1 class I SAM-dependent methyltransferase [Tetrasphaera sp. F2B08]
MDVATVRWLASPQGFAALRSLPPYDPATELAEQTRLRRDGFSPEQTAALLTQARLRLRARDKFGEFADGMLFTSDGLEQASRLEVAAQHAERYARASLATVHDLGCGIGADAMALSVLGVTVAAIDADPVTARVADANLRPWPDSRARHGFAEDFEPPADPVLDRVGVWMDPARRTPGVADLSGRTRRVFRLDEMAPSWDYVLEVARVVPATGVKLSPSFPHGDQPPATEAQWVSLDGDLLECVVWFGPLVRRRGRTALVLSSSPDSGPVRVDASMAGEVPARSPRLGELGPWLYEPDHAVTRAGLLGAVTVRTDGLELEPGLGYVSADRHVDLPFARRYAVSEAMPFNVKSLRSWLRARGITGVTIKKRGIRLDEDRLRRDLRITRKAGDGAQATIVLTRVSGQPSVLVVTPD